MALDGKKDFFLVPLNCVGMPIKTLFNSKLVWRPINNLQKFTAVSFPDLIRNPVSSKSSGLSGQAGQ